MPSPSIPFQATIIRMSKVCLPHNTSGCNLLWNEAVDLNPHMCSCISKKKCALRHSLAENGKPMFSCRWVEFKNNQPSFHKAGRKMIPTPFASTDDGITVNGTPQASSCSDVEEMRVKFDQSLQGEDLSSGLVQSIHDAAKRRRGSVTNGSVANIDDDFDASTFQSKKRVSVLKDNQNDCSIDLDLDGCDVEATESSLKPKQKASGRVMPQWAKSRNKSGPPLDNLFNQYAYKK